MRAARRSSFSVSPLTAFATSCSVTATTQCDCKEILMSDAPLLAGIHHLKLPVSDLARSLEWYQTRLGYQLQIEFVEQGVLMGVALCHPNGGPDLALRLDAQKAEAAAGFDY